MTGGPNKVGRFNIETHDFDLITIPVNPHYYEVWDIASGPDNAVWFAASFYSEESSPYNGEIGRIDDSTLAITEYHTGYAYSYPESIIEGSSSTMWYIDTDNGFNEFSITSHTSTEKYGWSDNDNLTSSPDGTLWSTIEYGSEIDHYDPDSKSRRHIHAER